MKPVPRPSTPADAAAIAALFAEARMDLDPGHLHWKYWQPRADWPRPRSFVIVSGSELIAHVAIMPGTCAWGTRRETIIQMIDWVARAGTGMGVMLMKHVGQMAGALLSIGGGRKPAAFCRISVFVLRARQPAMHGRPFRCGYCTPVRRGKCCHGWLAPPGGIRHPRKLAPTGKRAVGPDEIGQIDSVFPLPIQGSP